MEGEDDEGGVAYLAEPVTPRRSTANNMNTPGKRRYSQTKFASSQDTAAPRLVTHDSGYGGESSQRSKRRAADHDFFSQRSPPSSPTPSRRRTPMTMPDENTLLNDISQRLQERRLVLDEDVNMVIQEACASYHRNVQRYVKRYV